MAEPPVLQRAELPPHRRARQHVPARVAEAAYRPGGTQPDDGDDVRPVQLDAHAAVGGLGNRSRDRSRPPALPTSGTRIGPYSGPGLGKAGRFGRQLSAAMYAPTSWARCWLTPPSRRSAWASWKCPNAGRPEIGLGASSAWPWKDTCTNEPSSSRSTRYETLSGWLARSSSNTPSMRRWFSSAAAAEADLYDVTSLN